MELKIAPSEAWNLDYVELGVLMDIKPQTQQDSSHMVNAARRMNGMPQGFVKNIN